MTKCLCPRCAPDPAFSYTPEFMLLCEGRYLLSLPPDGLARYLEEAEKKKMGDRVRRALIVAQVPF